MADVPFSRVKSSEELLQELNKAKRQRELLEEQQQLSRPPSKTDSAIFGEVPVAPIDESEIPPSEMPDPGKDIMQMSRDEIQGGKLPKNRYGQRNYTDTVGGGSYGIGRTNDALQTALDRRGAKSQDNTEAPKTGGMQGAGVEDNVVLNKNPEVKPPATVAPVTSRTFPTVPAPAITKNPLEERKNSISVEEKSSRTGPNARARELLEEANKDLDVKLMTPEELRTAMDAKNKEGRDISSAGNKKTEETQAQAYAKNRMSELIDKVIANTGQVVAGITGLNTGLNVAKDYKKEYMFDRKLEDEVVREQTSLMKAATKAMADGKADEAKQIWETYKAFAEVAKKNAAERTKIAQALGSETSSNESKMGAEDKLFARDSVAGRKAAGGAAPKETLSQRVPVNPAIEREAEEKLGKVFGVTGRPLLMGPTEAAYVKTWAPLNEVARATKVDEQARRMLFNPAKLKERAITYPITRPVQARIKTVMDPNYRLNGKPIDDTMRRNMVINILRDGGCILNSENKVAPAKSIAELSAGIPYYPANGDVNQKHLIRLINEYLIAVSSIQDKEEKYTELGEGGYGGQKPSYMFKTASVIPEPRASEGQ